MAEYSLFRWQWQSRGRGGFINHLTVTCVQLYQTQRLKKKKLKFLLLVRALVAALCRRVLRQLTLTETDGANSD